jgi:hypothetical protein
MKLLILQFSPTSCNFIPLLSKYFPQYPILKYPQFMILQLKSDAKSHAHTDLRQNYSFVYFNLYVYRQKARRHKILDCMVESITRI